MLLLSVTIAAVAPPSIRIVRVPADGNFLFPTNAKQLTRFMMDETYGECKPFSGAWAQRGVLDAAADSDFFGRLQYYEKTQSEGRPCGSIFKAQRVDTGELCGFADIGASLWLPNDQAYRLPQDADLQRLATTGIGADGQRKPGVALRPYVSNLVVDSSLRRCGIGRRLMEACEEEATLWADACSVDGVAECDAIWLEVTTTNQAGLAFYRSLGYVEHSQTAGSEVQRQGDSGFSMGEVKRSVMRKPLTR